MTKLIIAEKPSVATDIARVLGGMKKKGDFYEGNGWIVANALGHLLELSCPEKYEVKRGKWTFSHLPVLPPSFDLKPIAKSKEKLKSLAKLIARADVDTIINACDAGREGELIFRYIMQATKAKKKIERLWLQSMTPGSIKEAFNHLRSDEQMTKLADAARSRSEADWLVGINGTRAMTAFNSRDGGFFLTTVGRVQTPTLAIVVRRENEIHNFVPEKYSEIEAEFSLGNTTYLGRWFDPKFKKDAKNPEKRAERIFDGEKAKAICEAVKGKTGTVEETAKRTTSLPAQLFDLTSLQREANNRFGFSAKTTLSIAQALYEKHKALTYPRTDSRVLPEDYVPTVYKTLAMLSSNADVGQFANRVTSGKWVHLTKRVFDNAKISDHFAIIPTLLAPKSALTEAEKKIYDLVLKRFISVFFPAAEYDVTTRNTTVGKEHFKTEAKVLVNPGWLEVYGKEGLDGSLAAKALGKDKVAKVIDAKKLDCETKPPARFTEATLLSAMEGAGRLVDDDELREAMGEKGLGTPATRAAIIENLIDQRYIRREGRELIPSAKAKQLFTLIEGLGIGVLSNPALTGEWEYKLSEIEKGKLKRIDFMREIREMTTHIVDKAKQYEGDTVPMENPVHLKHRCPKCGGEVVENYRRYACTNPECDFSLPKHPGGRTFEVSEVETLLEKGAVGPLPGFISKLGRPYSAVLRLNAEKKIEFDFGQEEKAKEEENVADLPVIGTCPKCGGKIFEGATTYFCENTKDKQTCDFRCGRVILQQPVSVAEFQKILAEKKSSLLTGFVSNRTHRKFKAYLVLDKKTGKINFEFQERQKAEPKKSESKTATKTVARKRKTTKA